MNCTFSITPITLRELFIMLLMFLATSLSRAQQENQHYKIDSLLSLSWNDSLLTTYKAYQKALLLSKEIDDNYRITNSYINLIKHFGYRKELDSLLKFTLEFENKYYKKIDDSLKYSFSFNKAVAMLTHFNQVEESLVELTKLYNYLDVSNNNRIIELNSALAYAYMTKGQYEKTIEILEPLLAKSNDIDQFNKLRLLTVLGNAYQCIKKTHKSFSIHSKALEIAKSEKDSFSYYFIKNSIIYDYYLNGEFKKVIDSGLRIRFFLEKYRPDLIQSIDYTLSAAYDTIGRSDSAIKYLENIVSKRDKFDHNMQEALGRLAVLYEKNGLFKDANKSLWERASIVDSIRNKEKKAFVDFYETKVSIINQQRERDQIKAEKKILSLQNRKQKQYIWILSIGISCFILVLLIIWVYSKYFKSKEKIKKLEHNEREILKNHIEVRETELTALAANKSKLLSELSDIKNELTSAIRSNNSNDIKDVEKNLKSFLIQTANDDVFSERLESQYPSMVMTLRKMHPLLSQNDIRHCILIKLGLSLKESANLMHVGIGAIKMGRNRAKSKMNISQEISLKEYLNSISEDDKTSPNKIFIS